MCENEYVAHMMVKERIREAEARGAFDALLREAATSPAPAGSGAARRRRRATPAPRWRQVTAAWVAHLALPKMWNRL
jgi:hypothetical protein